MPLQADLFLAPCRKAPNTSAAFSPTLAIASLPLPLCADGRRSTAGVIGLFVHEFFVGLGDKLKGRIAGWTFLAAMFCWVSAPLHVMR